MQTQSGSKFSYRYDDNGNRIYKEINVSNGTTEKEYYLRDQTGKEIAVYDVATQKLKMVNLYGNDLVGRINVNWEQANLKDPETGQSVVSYVPCYDRYYYLKDHLGNIIETVSEK